MRGGGGNLRAYLVIFAFALLGLASAVYVVVSQGGGSRPFGGETFVVKAAFGDVGGVSPGIGQPVNVVGVEVGTITAAELEDNGSALVSMEIERDKLAQVNHDATAALVPVTPLKDMSIELSPGTAQAEALPDGGVISRQETSEPVALDQILSGLDSDTRAFLSTMITSLGEGTRGRAKDLRKMLASLGPTTAQVREIAQHLDGRRSQLRRLVHNLGRVTEAATQDERLAVAVDAGNTTLRALARQDRNLRTTLSELPPTLSETRRTLSRAAEFSRELKPAADALAPALSALPAALRGSVPFTTRSAKDLREQVRPLTREAQDLAADLGVAVPKLSALAPDMVSNLQTTNYVLNEFAHNPPGNEEGYLYYLAWGAHNFNTTVSIGDAHSVMGRAFFAVHCELGAIALREVELLIRSMFPDVATCAEGVG